VSFYIYKIICSSDSISNFNNLYKVVYDDNNYYKNTFFHLKFKFFNPNLIKTLKITYLSQFIN